eukprot:Polyplicarium_translucidae@DN3834_c0_g1_i1.p1
MLCGSEEFFCGNPSEGASRLTRQEGSPASPRRPNLRWMRVPHSCLTSRSLPPRDGLHARSPRRVLLSKIREVAWRPQGRNVPDLATLGLPFDEAWSIGMQGCMAVKHHGEWSRAFYPEQLRYTVVDGTSQDHFLSVYKFEGIVGRQLQLPPNFTPKVYSMAELRAAEWEYAAKSVTFRPRRSRKKVTFEQFGPRYFDSMLLCLMESEATRLERQLSFLRQLEAKAKMRLARAPLPATAAEAVHQTGIDLEGRVGMAARAYNQPAPQLVYSPRGNRVD